jgi:hypothetical protein
LLSRNAQPQIRAGSGGDEEGLVAPSEELIYGDVLPDDRVGQDLDILSLDGFNFAIKNILG